MMKSLRKLTRSARDKLRAQFTPPDAEADEFKDGMQDVAAMRARYESLLSIAGQTSRRAYQLATSQQELATCLSDMYGGIDNREIGECFRRVGRVQMEVSKLLDLYSSHITQTLSQPTEELLHELRYVEESKRNYDEKRQIYDAQKVRASRSRRVSKGEANGPDPLLDDTLLASKDEFDDAAMQLGCQLLTLEQKRPRALVMQAVKHHVAQTKLFSSALEALQSMGQYIQELARQRNVSLSLGDTDDEDGDDGRSDGSRDNVEQFEWDHGSDSPRSVGAEVQELPSELPPEWDYVLTELDSTLQDMGAETLDREDAIFAMNAMLTAATESTQDNLGELGSHPPPPRRHKGSKSAPLSATGGPLAHLFAMPSPGAAATALAASDDSSGGVAATGQTVPSGNGPMGWPPGTSRLTISIDPPPSPRARAANAAKPELLHGQSFPSKLPSNSHGGATGNSKGGFRAAVPSAPIARSSLSLRAKSGPLFSNTAVRTGPLVQAGGGAPLSQTSVRPPGLGNALVANGGPPSAPRSISPSSWGQPPPGNSSTTTTTHTSKSGPIVLQMNLVKKVPVALLGGSAPEDGPHPLPTLDPDGSIHNSSKEPSAGPAPIPIRPSGLLALGRAPISSTLIGPSPTASPPTLSPPNSNELYVLPPPPLTSTATTPPPSIQLARPPTGTPPPILAAPNGQHGVGKGLKGARTAPDWKRKEGWEVANNSTGIGVDAAPIPLCRVCGEEACGKVSSHHELCSAHGGSTAPNGSAGARTPSPPFSSTYTSMSAAALATNIVSPSDRLRRSLSFGPEAAEKPGVSDELGPSGDTPPETGPQEWEASQGNGAPGPPSASAQLNVSNLKTPLLQVPESPGHVMPLPATPPPRAGISPGMSGPPPGGSSLDPFASSMPLAMPPSTPPDRPESQGALGVLSAPEHDELVKAVSQDNVKWRVLDRPLDGGLRRVPDWEDVPQGVRKGLLGILAQAVVSWRHMIAGEGGGLTASGYPDSPLHDELW